MQKINPNNLPQGLHNCLAAHLTCKGIKGRDRSVKFHHDNIGYYSTDTSLDDIKEIALEHSKNFKSILGNQVEISLRKHQFEIEGHLVIQKMIIDSDYFNCPKMRLDIQ
jgi:hypothetical protein